MCKMLTGFAALLVAGLLGGACGGHSGLKSGQDGASAAGGATGSQAGSSVSSAIVGGAARAALSVRVESRRAEPVALSAARVEQLSVHRIHVSCWRAVRTDSCRIPTLAAVPSARLTLTPASRTTLAVRTAPRRVSFRPVHVGEHVGEFESHGRCARQLGPRTIFVGMRACEREHGKLPEQRRHRLRGKRARLHQPVRSRRVRLVRRWDWSWGRCAATSRGMSDGPARSRSGVHLLSLRRSLWQGRCFLFRGGPKCGYRADASLCPPGFVWEGDACPSPNLECPGGGNPPPLCSNSGTCVCGADGIWVFFPGMCD